MKKKIRDIFSTGDIAQICRVAVRTVAIWFDKGILKGFRLPGGEDRRVPKEELVKFMKDNNIPLEWLEDYEVKEDRPTNPEERIKYLKVMIELAPIDKKAEKFLRGFLESVAQNPGCPVSVIADMAKVVYEMRNKELEEWNKKNQIKG